MRQHAPLIWFAILTAVFAVLAWPLAVHAQGAGSYGSAGGYGSSGGTFSGLRRVTTTTTYGSYGSTGGTYTTVRRPTQVLPRLRARDTGRAERSVLRSVSLLPVALPEVADRCDCGCDCPGCACQ